MGVDPQGCGTRVVGSERRARSPDSFVWIGLSGSIGFPRHSRPPDLSITGDCAIIPFEVVESELVVRDRGVVKETEMNLLYNILSMLQRFKNQGNQNECC